MWGPVRYKCAALALTSFFCHFPLFSDALLLMSIHTCCSVPTVTGVSSHLLSRLQSITNAAARLIFYVRRSEHVTPLLHDLHWLRVPERIQFRLCSDIPVSPWFCAVIPGQALLLLGLKPKGHKNQTTKYACILNLGVQY